MKFYIKWIGGFRNVRLKTFLFKGIMRYSSTVGLSDTSFFLQSRKCLKGCHNKNLALFKYH